MVTDSLQNLEQYRGLHKNMDTVIDFLKKCDPVSYTHLTLPTNSLV